MGFNTYRIPDFSGGMVDFYDADLIKDNQASWTKNCCINIVGRLSSRGGQKDLNSLDLGGGITGLYSYYAEAIRKLIVVSNGVAYHGDHIGIFTELKSGLSSDPYEFETCVNYMVAYNGSDVPWKWDGSTVSNLQNSPQGVNPVLHAEKLFIIVDDDTIRFSESFKPEEWPEVNVINFDKGDGDQLVGMVQFLGDMLIFKRRSIYKLAGTSLDDFRQEKVEKRYGAVSQRSIVVDGIKLYYIGEDGIFQWNGLQSINLIETSIPNFWKRVNRQYIHKSCACKGLDGLLWFSVPIDDSTVPNCVLAYDPRFNSWWPWFGINASVFVTFNSGSKMYLYSGHPTEGVVVEQGVGYNDRGYAIDCEWVGKEFGGDEPEMIKKIKKMYVTDSYDLGEVIAEFRVDGGEWKSGIFLSDIDGVRRYSISENCRYFQPRFRHSVLNQDFAIRNFAVRYFKVRPK